MTDDESDRPRGRGELGELVVGSSIVGERGGGMAKGRSDIKALKQINPFHSQSRPRKHEWPGCMASEHGGAVPPGNFEGKQWVDSGFEA